MKKDILYTLTFILLSYISSFAQLIEFEEYPSTLIADFDAVDGSSIAFADVDGDGDQDVFITGQDFSNQKIAKLYKNNGSGNFSKVFGTPFVGVTRSSVAFADVDGDGDQDLLITGSNPNNHPTARLYLNNGVGNFSQVIGTPFIGASGSSIAFADVDGDGDQDVLITGQNVIGGQKSSKLYQNDGTGNFSEVIGTPFIGVASSSIAFSDVDGDGDQDVLITGSNPSNQPSSHLYLNDGDGNYSVVTNTPFESVDFSSIAFSDVDGDGDQDVLITGMNLSNQPISNLYVNDGGGNFSVVPDSPFENVDSSSIAFSDVDGDGDQDVFISGYNTSNQPIAKIYINDGFGNFSELLGTPFDNLRVSSIAFSDFNGDGNQYLMITGRNATGMKIAKLYVNDGDANFNEIVGEFFDSVRGSSISFADIDGDGDQDVLITGRNAYNHKIAKLYQNDGSGNFTEVLETPFDGVNISSIAFSDIDGDNDQDVLITGVNSSNQLIAKLYQNDGSGNYSEVIGTPFEGVSWPSIAFADIDGDGDQDVLITGQNNFSQRIAKLYQNDGDGNFSEVIGTPFIGVSSSSIAFADVDGDGDQDVLISGWNPSNQPIAKLYQNDGIGNFNEVLGTPFDGVWGSSIAFADVDGDYDQDVIIVGRNSSNQSITKLYLNDGIGNFSEVLGTPFEGVWRSSIAFADVDGDGDQDVLITGEPNVGSKIAKLYQNDGSGNYSEVIGTPFIWVSYSSIAFSDIDGDGDQDLLITGSPNSGPGISKLYRNITLTTVGITENSFKSSLKLYPNPTTETFIIDMGSANKENTNISIIDIHGRLVKELSFKNNQVIEISLQNEPVGMYFVEILSGKEKAVYKLLKQ